MGFALEPCLEIVVPRNPGVEQLQCVPAGQARMLDQEYLAHAGGA
jgi:hypothetical protein